MANIWVYCTNHPKKPTNIVCFKCGYCKIIITKLMFILWPLCKYSHWTLCFWNSFNAIMQQCNMFQFCIYRQNFTKISMQCSHSKHPNIIQMWGNNYNKTKLLCIQCKYHIYQNFRKCSKNGKHELMPLFMPKKPK
jgi:hypothetical protein